MKTTQSLLASVALIVLTSLTLHATEYQTGTFFLQSLGGTSGPPYPYDPSFGTLPLTQIGPDEYIVQDSGSGSFQSGGMMTMDSLDPGDTNSVGTNGYTFTPLPLLRNYVKYGTQTFALIDTNSVLNDANDTNLYNACVAVSGPTNGLPWLTIAQYGPNAVIIRADNFDYSTTNADFALIVGDNVATPTWKTIDFSGASDAQDGWLVQGIVPQSQVTSTMFMLVTNINLIYPTFFRAIPYSGPQVAITGTNQPYDTVSNIITLTAQIYDLSGTSNELFLVDVNGDAVSTHSSLSNNAITLDTKYNPNGQDYGIDNVDLTVQGFATVYGYTTNAPGDTKLIFTSATSIPLDFENVNYLLFQSALAERDIGTNAMLWACNKEEDVTCTISDPSSNVVAYYSGHIAGPSTVEIDWNFTEADGVTPYSNSTYLVHFTASDPDDFYFPNQIANNDEIRTASGCYITYEQEPTITTDGEYTDEEDQTWLDETLKGLYQDMYYEFGITEYNNSDVGPNRNYGDCQGLIQNGQFPRWADFMGPALSNSYTSFVDGLDYPRYSDLTIGGAHGTGTTIGGPGEHSIPWLADTFTPAQLQSWLQAPNLAPQWRLRKVAIWACDVQNVELYSQELPGPQGQTNGTSLDFISACGIRDVSIQVRNYVHKNTGWATSGLLPNRMQGPDSVDSTAQVAEEADELWVCGANAFPGACDPTYTSYWVGQQMYGLYPVLAPTYGGGPDLNVYGYPFLPYTSIYDGQLESYTGTIPPFVHNR